MSKKRKKLNKRNFQLGAVIFLLAVFIISCALFWPSDFFKNFARAISGNYSKTDGQIIDANIWNTLANDFVSYTGGNKDVDLGAHNFTVNTNTFFVDAANGRVGVGTVSPGNYKLDVAGNLNFTGTLYQNGSPFSADSFWSAGTGGIYYSAGKVGIGISAPNKDLHVKTASGNAEIDIQSADSPLWGIYQDDGTDDLRFWNVDNRMTITNDGNVGIGTTNPGAKLHINDDDGVKFLISDDGAAKVQHSTTGFSSYFKLLDNTTLELWDGTQRAQITANGYSWFIGGNVGIGTTAPTAPLSVVSSATRPQVKISYDGTTGLFFTDATESTQRSWQISSSQITSQNLEFTPSTANGGTTFTTPSMVIQGTSGNVGIGTTNPTAKLSITGAGTDHPDLEIGTSNDTAYIQVYDRVGSNGYGNLRLITKAGDTMYLDDSGNVGIGTTNPGEKLEVSGNIKFGSYLYATYGTVVASYDEWLRLNPSSSHSSGVYVANGLRADGGLTAGGYSLSSGEVRANIFRDGDSSYYVDPASTSVMHNVSASGYVYMGYEIIQVAGNGYAQATCSSGKYVIGGGCRCYNDSSKSAWDNFPASQTWSCGMSGCTDVRAFAICARIAN
ncbi:hypothetical protein COV49_04425 [Candidatus Falkowbacteria bacterium CG11_big_fil_rev_8_21_14_0_20_39_10]|uniref:Uncharacterized protein n=1 Tax=Candidatus Falkowbacteria bacterium CG11_big_fil_rev_8_21_14_0_20_39_10 TaxID=1974570 RepID=A0A2M6K7Y8_9BACT|nr:MAG: hypothetical protein COV49_04425 [Candidatus Falkowbacteria bacterium CG11_big_fil_rev_8_21_14_0_20_39_10]